MRENFRIVNYCLLLAFGILCFEEFDLIIREYKIIQKGANILLRFDEHLTYIILQKHTNMWKHINMQTYRNIELFCRNGPHVIFIQETYKHYVEKGQSSIEIRRTFYFVCICDPQNKMLIIIATNQTIQNTPYLLFVIKHCMF